MVMDMDSAYASDPFEMQPNPTTSDRTAFGVVQTSGGVELPWNRILINMERELPVNVNQRESTQQAGKQQTDQQQPQYPPQTDRNKTANDVNNTRRPPPQQGTHIVNVQKGRSPFAVHVHIDVCVYIYI